MRVGIIGRAGSGRATLFEGLTGQQSAAGQRARMRLGVARVEDPRVDRLVAICKPRKTVHAELTLALPPGGLDVPALRELREIRAYAHVVGAFSGEPLVEEVTTQLRELSAEMVLADMERVENRVGRLAKGAAARPGEQELLAAAGALLEQEQPLRLQPWDEQATKLLDELGIVSHRPVLTVVNAAEELATATPPADVVSAARAVGSEVLWLCAALELEISRLDAESRDAFLAEYGLDAPVSQRFARACLALLDQICFFTVGPDEVRAWPLQRASNARRAARAIHSDLEKGFIRAEVIPYDVFVAAGSEARCRETGQLRVEGKDYVVLDGDIITVRFNI
jgi:ribosome-binding ATPase YchF (GTP1/OBG family)